MKIQFFLILVSVIFFVFTLSNVEAGTNIIEFKKKYVINSPKVCGDKLCNEEMDTAVSIKKNLHTPLAQYKLGVPIHQITCKNHLSFVLKVSNWHPACVKLESVQKLVDKGWAATLDEKTEIFEATEKKEDPLLKPLKEYRKEYPLYEGLGLSITTDIISGESYLIFEGYGWHGFHNVEIFISNNLDKSEFIMTQTDDRGNLHMPWKIPPYFTSGLYHIRATDGIHEYDIDIPITVPEK